MSEILLKMKDVLRKDILFPSAETVNLDILLRNIAFTILLTCVAAAVHNLAKKPIIAHNSHQ